MKKIQSRIFKLSVIFLIVSLFGLYFEKGTGETVWGQVSEDKNAEENTGTESDAVKMNLEDGEYSIQVDLEGGSGKAGISSPTPFEIRDGLANSVFEIPVTAMDEPVSVIADTTAMGSPHEVEYTLLFYSDSIGSKGQLPQEAAKRVVAVALAIIVGGGILNYFVNKRKRC